MPLLTNDLWREWLAVAIRDACKSHVVALWAYVFMPEHVHLLVKPRLENYDISQFRKSVKQGVAKRVINSLKKERASLLEKLRVLERSGKWCYRFWQEGPGHDKNIWSIDKAVKKAHYYHRNPVTRRLVKDPACWKWSSFRWVEMSDCNNAPLAIDSWDELLVERGP